MGFLSGIFLIAIPLVGVPILLHFYQRKQPDIIDWGAMQFLLDVEGTGQRWQKLEELLLMLLRAAAVAALILALAQPMIRGAWIGNHPQREVVLLVDDSLSTAAASADGTMLDGLKRRSVEILGDLTGDDQVQIMAASCGGRWLTAEAIPAHRASHQQITSLLESIQPTEGATDLLACLNAILRLESPKGSTSRDVYLFTDDQSASWRTDAADAWRSLGELCRKHNPRVNLHVVTPSSTKPQSNLAVGPLEASRYVVRKGEQVRLKAVIANYSDKASDPMRVRWSVAGKQVAESTLAAIAAGETAQTTTAFDLKETGVHVVECRIDANDDLKLDQFSQAVIEVAERIPVLVVVNTLDSDGAKDSLDPGELFTAALGYRNGKPQPWHSVFEPRVIGAKDFASQNLRDYAAVMITDLEALSPENVKRLEAFVAACGGAWISLGSLCEQASFNTLWHDDGEGLCPWPLEGLAVAEVDEATTISIHPPSAEHPATLHLDNTSQLDIDKVRIRQHWRFKRSQQTRKDTSVLLESENGEPLVIEKYYGHGRVIVQTVPIGLEWSNLPVLKAFVVMVQHWLDYLTVPSRARYNLTPGTPIIARAPTGDGRGTATIVPPNGQQTTLLPWRGESEGLYRYTQTMLPGQYRVDFSADGTAQASTPYHVIRGLEESNLERLTDKQRTEMAEWAGLRFAGDVEAKISGTSENIQSQPFWWVLLTLLAALLAAEFLLSTHLGRRRWAPPLVSS